MSDQDPTSASSSAGHDPRLLVPLREGDRVGNYTVVRPIGTGGMGAVYEAVQDQPHRTVALKVMASGVTSLVARKRFQEESEFLARISHPAVAQVFEAGSHETIYGPVAYYGMEYVRDGRPVTEWARTRGLGVADRLALMAQVCRGVHAGHTQGVIHRDLKPSNILVDSSGAPKVIDFGVARMTLTDRESTTTLTRVGDLVGTVQYMSPEQVEGDSRRLDIRSDVYSLGVVLYELLCGRLPYELTGTDLPTAARVIRTRAPTPPGTVAPDLDRASQAIVLKALQKDRERRYRTAEEMAADIERCLRGEVVEAARVDVVGWTRAAVRSVVARHPVAVLIVGTVLLTLATGEIGLRIVFRWTSINSSFEHTMMSMGPAAAPQGGMFESVRVISLAEDNEILQGLFDLEGLTGFDPANKPSLRSLHGRLMQRLARSGLRALVWDFTFRKPSDFDGEFVKGTQALRGAGVDVVAAAYTWTLEEDGQPEMSPAIRDVVRWGGATSALDPGMAPTYVLAVRTGLADPKPSIVLQGLICYKSPGNDAALSIGPDNRTLGLAYFRPGGGRTRVFLGDEERIPVADVSTLLTDDAANGLRAGEQLVQYPVDLPALDVLEKMTVPYGAVFDADDAQLQAWFKGRLVLVGDRRDGTDSHPWGGRTLWGPHINALAADRLLRSAPLQLPRGYSWLGLTAAGSTSGVLAVLLGGRNRLRLVTLLAVFALVAIAGSVLAYRGASFLCNPAVPIAAMVLAAAWASWVIGRSDPRSARRIGG